MPAIPPEIRLPDTEAFRPQNLWETVERFNHRLRTGDLESYRPTPLGFPQLDDCLGGGLHAEDLCLVGGMQNVGKTIFVLQVARNLAWSGEVLPIVVCYEHSPETLLHRLLCLESVVDLEPESADGLTRTDLEQAILGLYGQGPGNDELPDLDHVLQRLPAARRAWFRLREYLWRLWLVRGDGLETTDFVLREYVRMARHLGHRRVMLIVDYAQRVPLRPALDGAVLSEAQRIDLVMRGLKSLAMEFGVPVMAVAAADAEGLRKGNVRFEDLWGPATVQYEPDVAIILNREALDQAAGQYFVRIGIEKNRHGPSEVEFRHRLHGAFYMLSPRGDALKSRTSKPSSSGIIETNGHQ